MTVFRTASDVTAIEAEGDWASLNTAPTIHDFLSRIASVHGQRPAITFQLTSGPKDKAQTLTWGDLLTQVTRAANLFRSLGIGPTDTVAFVLPNCLETVVTMLGGIQVSNDKEFVTALTNSESFNFRTCRMAFEFLYGRRENRCEGPVFDRCMKEFRTQGTLQSAVASVVKDNSFCQ